MGQPSSAVEIANLRRMIEVQDERDRLKAANAELLEGLKHARAIFTDNGVAWKYVNILIAKHEGEA